ncbi:MAG: hypothetical protein PHO26_00540 [Dehalococcoidia bacterium]|nr:hypothetical protein [Dehalococcoidia bacterium]MDD5494393.1 hypothetical protein [Dehalococcoidia bacterium]
MKRFYTIGIPALAIILLAVSVLGAAAAVNAANTATQQTAGYAASNDYGYYGYGTCPGFNNGGSTYGGYHGWGMMGGRYGTYQGGGMMGGAPGYYGPGYNYYR